MAQIDTRNLCEPAELAEWGRSVGTPFVIRNAARHWPLVGFAGESDQAALAHLVAFDRDQPAEVMIGPPEIAGRFFYSDDVQGLNFRREFAPLRAIAERLLVLRDEQRPPAIYAGALATASHLPGFDQANPFDLALAQPRAQSRVWLSNRCQVATHFDMSDNIAVVALGRRRFTLFPPEATGDLYIGPLNFTLAGQPVSMVDPLAADLVRYPRYTAAKAKMQQEVLEPGDAIFIPAMWWHHVEALDPVNLLVNYWYNDLELGGGFLALVHAMMAVRDLAPTARNAWQHWFDHFVFGPDAQQAADHLPPTGQGINGPPGPVRNETIRRFLVQVLGSS
jgi:hypothetical protein